MKVKRAFYRWLSARHHHARLWGLYCRALSKPFPSGSRNWGVVSALKRETDRSRQHLHSAHDALIGWDEHAALFGARGTG
jgi:hypothetical protein